MGKVREIRIRKVSQLHPLEQREVKLKLGKKLESFDYIGYAAVSYDWNLNVCNIEPIEGTVNDYFDSIMDLVDIERIF